MSSFAVLISSLIILSKGSNASSNDTLSPLTLPPISVPITTNILLTAYLDENDLINAEQQEPENLMGGMMIFAIVLTGLFCLCLCVGCWFCIDTKRKSKLRKLSMRNEWNPVQTHHNNNISDAMQSKMVQNENNDRNLNMEYNDDNNLDDIDGAESEKIERQITPYEPHQEPSIKLQRILMSSMKKIKSPRLKSPKLFSSKSPKIAKSPKSPKMLKVPDDDEENSDDDILCVNIINATENIRTLEQYEELENEETTTLYNREDTLTLDINEESVTKSQSVQNLIKIFDPHN